MAVTNSVPTLEGATGWLSTAPLDRTDLAGKVVLFDFWTYTCINWLRTLSYVRAWAEKYEAQGLVTIGVHTPEFPFERDPDNVRQAAQDLDVKYPIALDSNYAIWDAFDNRYWPAVYIADAQGQIRHHHFGEGGYDECERVIQELLRETGADRVGDELVTAGGEGFEAQADWAHLESPETYLGYGQLRNLASPGGVHVDEPHSYVAPTELTLNTWALSGDWTVARGGSLLHGDEGAIVFRFHARDVNLVLGPRLGETSVPFLVLLDGEPPAEARGLDVDEEGRGTVTRPRLYQLLRQGSSIADRTFEIRFLAPGIEAYVFTFG